MIGMKFPMAGRRNIVCLHLKTVIQLAAVCWMPISGCYQSVTFSDELGQSDDNTAASEPISTDVLFPTDIEDSDDRIDTSPPGLGGGSGLIAVTDLDQSMIRLVAADGSGTAEMTAAGKAYYFVDWFPEGRELLAEDGDERYVILDSSGAVVQSVPSIFAAYNPAVSPDGTRIAYESRAHQIYLWDRHDASARMVLPVDVDGASPSWSPNGDLLAFTSTSWGAIVSLCEGKLTDAGLDIRPLVNAGEIMPTGMVPPIWSADGESVLVGGMVSAPAGLSSDLFIVHRETLTIENITDSPAVNNQYYAWSPDNRFVAYISNNFALELLDLETGDRRLLYEGQGVGRTPPKFSPDGRWLAFQAGTQLATVDVQGQDLTVFDAPQNIGVFGWQPK